MGGRTRLFVAVDFPKLVKQEIVESTKGLRKKFPQVSWVKQKNLHLTLKFLGNVNTIRHSRASGNLYNIKNMDPRVKPEDDRLHKNNLLNSLKLSIRRSLNGVKPFRLQFNSLGFFDRGELIIWLGIVKNQSLSSLVNSLEAELSKLGFRKEVREFNPHVTIGRGKRLTIADKKRIKNYILSTKFTHMKNYYVPEISLMQSKMVQQGSIYSTIQTFPFLLFNV